MEPKELNYQSAPMKSWTAASTWIRQHAATAQSEPLGLMSALTLRDEANALSAYAFRNGYLETMHAGPAGFPDEEMKKIMIEGTARLAAASRLKQVDPRLYLDFLTAYGELYCGSWSRAELEYQLITPTRSGCPACAKAVLRMWNFCASCGHRLTHAFASTSGGHLRTPK